MVMPRQKRGRSKQDYQTPEDFLTAAKGLLGIEEFDWDLAASKHNTVRRVRYYDTNDDSLSMSWSVAQDPPGWLWLNPPFANIRPWVEKAYESKAQIAMLVPASTGANWWRDWVHRKVYILLLNGRIKFVGQKDPYPKDCALLLYGGIRRWPGYHIWTWRDQS